MSRELLLTVNQPSIQIKIGHRKDSWRTHRACARHRQTLRHGRTKLGRIRQEPRIPANQGQRETAHQRNHESDLNSSALELTACVFDACNLMRQKRRRAPSVPGLVGLVSILWLPIVRIIMRTHRCSSHRKVEIEAPVSERPFDWNPDQTRTNANPRLQHTALVKSS